MINCIYVGIGGFIGSILRYIIGLIPLRQQNTFPVKTLIINIVGAFLIGIVAALASKSKALNEQTVLLLKVGICGGFTTFSTFAFETSELLKSGSLVSAVIYISSSVILSVTAVFAAQIIFG